MFPTGKDRDLEVSVRYPSFRLHCLPAYLSQVTFLRKSHGSRLNVFAPINDLSTLSKTGVDHRIMRAGQQNDVAIAGGQILGDEYSDHVVRVRRCEIGVPLISLLIM